MIPIRWLLFRVPSTFQSYLGRWKRLSATKLEALLVWELFIGPIISFKLSIDYLEVKVSQNYIYSTKELSLLSIACKTSWIVTVCWTILSAGIIIEMFYDGWTPAWYNAVIRILEKWFGFEEVDSICCVHSSKSRKFKKLKRISYN